MLKSGILFDFFNTLKISKFLRYIKNTSFFSFLLYLSSIRTDVTDDYVEPTLRISSDSIILFKVGQKFQFTAKYFDTSGTQIENPDLIWTVFPLAHLV